MTISPPELVQAVHLIDAGEKELAIDLLRQILKQDPDNVQALLWLGGLTPDLDEGITILERVLRLDPENETAQRGLADLRARRRARVGEPAKAGPQDNSPPGSQGATEESSPPAAERAITGDGVLSLAHTIVWPFKGLNRPLGELLDEDAVQSRDLGWAARNASDPTVKWAAAVHLRTRDVQDISISPQEAGQVTWPFKGFNRPMRELLAEQTITLHDLAYAVANAYDGKVREAAAVLGAEIVQYSLPADDGPASPEPNAVSSARKISAATEEAPEEPQSPAVKPGKSNVGAEKKSGQLRVISGSPYLQEQEARKHRQSTILAWGLIALLCVAVVLGLMPMMLLVAGNNHVPIEWAILGLVFEAVVGRFTPIIWRLKAERDNFAAGRRGEERLVETLQCHLDGRWTLLRNLVLPDESGDIDAVLVGPRGVFALEVKTFTGYNRNLGKEWQRRIYGRWRDLDRNPTRQARRNATRWESI